MKKIILTITFGLLLQMFVGVVAVRAGNAHKQLRAIDLTSTIWSQFEKGEIQELVIEFRQDDQLPLTFKTEGDLLESVEVLPSAIVVKRSFWLKLQQNNIMLSLDGAIYKPFQEIITGSFNAGISGAQGSSVANAISLVFKAFLK